MKGAQALTVRLAIPAEEFERLYSGSARDVITVAESGETVRFPGHILRTQVSHEGVHGRFRIAFDSAGRFISIARL
ncbi:MAG: DUF2835 domain-containing protein [Woeseia sp.]|nr:DUF2835 domain-containing protein [Woeseia sp.]NNL55891.1 DUF2835 domain-containing protein [Woeseia sp.]